MLSLARMRSRMKSLRQGFVEGFVLANIYRAHMIQAVLRQRSHISIRFQYRLDGRWADAEGMDFETCIACLLYLEDCALFALSEAELPVNLARGLQVVPQRDPTQK